VKIHLVVERNRTMTSCVVIDCVKSKVALEQQCLGDCRYFAWASSCTSLQQQTIWLVPLSLSGSVGSFFSLEMANPEVVISTCGSLEEENPCTFNQNTSPSQELLLEDQMRRKLKFFFMNPCEKFWARGRKPWKLTIQILKIVMVTIQVRISHHNFSESLGKSQTGWWRVYYYYHYYHYNF
jgi:hypothetical protein